MKTVKAKLPPDKIKVKDGKVISIEEWTEWNLRNELTFTAKFSTEKGEFTLCNFDPEHGGSGPQTGKTIEEAANKVLHPNIAKNLIALFNLNNPTEKQIRELHYAKGERLEVIFQ